jgi:hypothetical protein
MAALEIGLAIADLGIARMWPCSAIVAPGIGVLPPLFCGATPASLYRKECGVHGHGRNVWLCPVHATMVMSGMSVCNQCAEAGGIVRNVRLARLTDPVRL